MKLAAFIHSGRSGVGVVDEASGEIRPVQVSGMLALVEAAAAGGAPPTPTGAAIPLAEVALQAPLIPPRNVICVGKNYREHAREFAQSGFEAGAVKGAEIDEFPAVFTKPTSCIVGPGATVSLHPGVTSMVDYEVELAVVIGRGGRDIKRADAFDHIFGYTIVNDVTARDRQRNHKQWFLGKALDTFCPMGPWITTRDEVDAENLDVSCWVNGELRQSANTRDLIFDIPGLVETISAGMTLLPGDVISTGTPAGVGIGLKPPRFLKEGDVVRMAIQGLGEISNRFA
ncbi:fumarylacetoacetate hydrolase family protein [Alsobacter sp. KACC 23698]|uniref:Fumarylacetoacetate hydrolase family protein n=1 Tax=Alsobacter sp. KACC 23698 TaxID=3149229 RepID=A0AAU7JLN9_9HYPH